MKTHSFLFFVFLLFSTSLIFFGCEKKGKCNKTNISSSGSTKSHNFGQNCLNCHKSGGEGEGCFSVAGSGLNGSNAQPLSSGVVKLFTQPNGGGQLKYSIQVDGNGNFHTTESIDISGLYPAITGPTGQTNYMSTAPGSGACNSCHGVSTGKITAN